MAFFSSKEHRSLQNQVSQLQVENGDLSFEVRSLKNQINSAKGIEAQAHEELEALSSEITDTAESVAIAGIVRVERERYTREAAENLQLNHGKQYAEDFRRREGPTIVENLRDTFKVDGTFARVEHEAEEEVKRDIQSEILEEKRAKIRSLLELPEEKAKLIDKFTEQISTSDAGESIRQQVEQELRQRWHEEVSEAVNTKINAEIEATEADFKSKAAESYLNSWQAKDRRDAKTKESQKRWTEATEAEVLATIENEEERNALAARLNAIKQNVEESESNISRKQLAELFATKGIDTATITEGISIKLRLGSIGIVKIKERKIINQRWEDVETEVDAVKCSREIQVISNGDNTFVVVDDSFMKSLRPHEKQAELAVGTVIAIGRCLTKNGERILDQTLVSNSNFSYDDNTTTTEFVDSLMTLADIELGGKSALGIDQLRYI